jgi:hypothetical protein
MGDMTLIRAYTVHACASCGVEFAVSDGYDSRRRDDGRRFYCPNGHTLSYSDTVYDRLQKAKDALAREQARHDQTRAQRDATERSRRATKGQLTRVKNRVAKGVCPCCNRSFADLAAHMATKHPEYAVEPLVSAAK